MEQQRVEAYRTYMSDSFALLHGMITMGKVDIPRYKDMFEPVKPQETMEQHMSRFDKIRRKGGNPQ